MALTLETVKEYLHYDPDTGHFTCIKPRRSIRVGDRAGTVRKDGRWMIGIGGKQYLSSRLAWFYMTGEWPHPTVDHEDCDGSNDCWSNLRVATKQEQVFNQSLRTKNTTGVKGVSRHKARFRARIKLNGKNVYNRLFDTLEQASLERELALVKIHGEFRRAA